MNFWKSDNTWIGWRFGILIPVLITLMFFNYAMPIGVLLVGLLIVFLFFFGLNYFTAKWASYSFESVEFSIFLISLIVRLLFLLYMYFLTYWLDRDSFPFEINAADSWVYHNVGLELADTPFRDWLDVLSFNMKSRSDFGYPLYQGLIYSLFGPNTIMVRVFNSILGAITVVLLGRFVKLSWGDSHAKVTAVIAMLFPTLVWYCGIQLKETLMSFLIVFSFYLIWRQRRSGQWSVWMILLSFTLCFSLFFFRTFLAVLAFISLLLTFIPIGNGVKTKNFLWAAVLIGIYLFYSLVASVGVFDDINRQVSDSEDFFSRNLENEKSLLGNVQFDQVALAPLIVAGAIITPFPSYLNTEERQLAIYTRFQNDLVRNMMYFFFYIGFYHVIRNKFKEYLSMIFFTIAYLAVITSAANSFQARFHMPIIPFIIIFIGVGVVEVKSKLNRSWSLYLILIFLAQLMWTYFKLNIRGING